MQKSGFAVFFIVFIYLVNNSISIERSKIESHSKSNETISDCSGGNLPGSHHIGVSLVFLSDFNLEVLLF